MLNVLCDKSIPMKGKHHKTVVRPAMTHGLEPVAQKKKQELELEMDEMKMMLFSAR